MNYGARGAMLIEPMTVATEHPVQWREPKTDLAELARLRWINRWSRIRIANKLNRSPETVAMYLTRLRRGQIERIQINPEERQKIAEAMKETFCGA